MTSIISIFSEAEIISAAMSVSACTRVFKLRDVRQKLMHDNGRPVTEFWKADQRQSKITGEMVSAVLRAHPDLFGVSYGPSGRIHSFYRAGGALV